MRRSLGLSQHSEARVKAEAALRRSAVPLAIFCAASMLLWTPIVLWLISPDRNVVLGNAGRFLVILTALIQLTVIVIGFVLHARAAGSTSRGAWFAGRAVGWVGYFAAVVWSWWVAMSMLGFSAGKLPVLVALSAAFLLPVLTLRAPDRFRLTVTLIFASLTLVTSAALTAQRLSPILIAPATVYIVAALTSEMFAQRARRGSR